MLLKLTELIPGVMNPEAIFKKDIIINSKYIQSIRHMPKRYPYKDEYTEITMVSGAKHDIGEKYEEVCKMLNI